MNTTASRPTETRAIGRVQPRRFSLGLLLADRADAQRRLDRYADHLLVHRINRELAGGKVGA